MSKEKFNINIALENNGGCDTQKINCISCKMGLIMYELNLKMRKDDLCNHQLVNIFSRIIKIWNTK
jgi:hypothetical protein